MPERPTRSRPTALARTHKVSTLYRRLSGIPQAHQAAGYVTPTTDAQVRLVFQGVRRTLGSAPDQKNAAINAEVRAMVETLSPTSLTGIRDRALLLVGFAGAFRRCELVSLDVADVTFGADSGSAVRAGSSAAETGSSESPTRAYDPPTRLPAGRPHVHTRTYVPRRQTCGAGFVHTIRRNAAAAVGL